MKKKLISKKELLERESWPAGLISIGKAYRKCHLLVKDREVVLIDTGLPSDLAQIRETLHLLGLKWSNIRAILLTHAHAESIGNLREIVRLSRAPVYMNQLDQALLQGQHSYRKEQKWFGLKQQFLRRHYKHYSSFVDFYVSDQDVINFWDCLRTIYLPGHTMGHIGFYSRMHKLLFCGDLFTCKKKGLLPETQHIRPQLIAKSFSKIKALNLEGIICNQYNNESPYEMKLRFDELYQELNSQKLSPV